MKRASRKWKTAASHTSCADAILRDALIRLNNRDADEMEREPVTCEELRFFRNTQAETLRLIRKNTRKLRFLQAHRVTAAFLLCVLLTFSVCCAAFPELRSLLFTLALSKRGRYTTVPLKSNRMATLEPVPVNPEDTALVPAGWMGSYYPAYIPEDFETGYMSDASAYVMYRNALRKTLIFKELEGAADGSPDMEGVDVTEILLNGHSAILSREADGASVFWTIEDRCFTLIFQGETDEAIRIAESVKKIR